MSTVPPAERGPAAVTVALQSDRPLADYGPLGRLVEDLGFDGVSVYADLGYQPALPALLQVAAHTDRVRLGPACLNPYLLHPVEIAGQIAMLDDASGGRAYLGLTRGSWLDRVGVEQRRPLAHLRDTVEIVARLLRGDDTGYAGRASSLAPGMRWSWRPVRAEVDVLLGVWGPQGVALASELAHEVKLGGSANPDMVALTRDRLRVAAADAGRPVPVVVAGAVTVVDDDGDRALALARREVAMYVDVVAALDPTVEVDPELLARLRALLAQGRTEDAGALLPLDLLRRFCFAGTPEQIAEHAAEVVAAGAGRVEFGTPHGLTGAGGIRLLGERVLPQLRADLGLGVAG